VYLDKYVSRPKVGLRCQCHFTWIVDLVNYRSSISRISNAPLYGPSRDVHSRPPKLSSYGHNGRLGSQKRIITARSIKNSHVRDYQSDCFWMRATAGRSILNLRLSNPRYSDRKAIEKLQLWTYGLFLKRKMSLYSRILSNKKKLGRRHGKSILPFT
jgi:hypothetical protein